MFEQSVLINYFDNFYNKVIESARENRKSKYKICIHN